MNGKFEILKANGTWYLWYQVPSVVGFRSESGSVLIAVIWTLALLAVFAVAVSHRASAELGMGQWMKDRIQTRLLAKAGIERALLEIQSDIFLNYDAFNESWGSNSEAFRKVELGNGYFSLLCDPENIEKEKKDQARYGACDEASRINVSTAAEDILTNLIKALEPRMDAKKISMIVHSMMDWRDTDEGVFPDGAEAAYYRALSPPYEPRNGALESVEELSMIRAIDRDLLEKMKPYVTVYTDGKVNFNTAPSVVLQALGISEALAERIIAYRAGPDQKEGTKDDLNFVDVGAITPAISAAGAFSSEEFAQISNAISAGNVSVKSDVYRIRSIGRLIRGTRTIDNAVTCVVRRDGTVLYWQEQEN